MLHAEIPKRLRTLKDIANASNIKKEGCCKVLSAFDKGVDLKMPVVDPVKCVARIASKAGLSEKTKRKAIPTSLEESRRREISAGKDPMGLVVWHYMWRA